MTLPWHQSNSELFCIAGHETFTSLVCHFVCLGKSFWQYFFKYSIFTRISYTHTQDISWNTYSVCCALISSILCYSSVPWWRHPMETFSALLAFCAGNSPVPGEFPTQRPVTRSFIVFFDLRLNKQLSKQSWGWWFETLPRPLWCHSNAIRLMTELLHCHLEERYVSPNASK